MITQNANYAKTDISEKIANPVDQIAKIAKIRIIVLFVRLAFHLKMGLAPTVVPWINVKFAQTILQNAIFANKVIFVDFLKFEALD